MSLLKYIYTRLRGFFRKQIVEDELDAELRFHLIMKTRENLHGGLTTPEAADLARRRFGNLAHIKDLCREISGGGMLETLWKDLHFGARQLIKRPSFALIAILSLALGIGANTAIFSLVSLVLLRPLPIAQPEQVFSVFPMTPNHDDNQGLWSYPNYKDVRDRNQVLSGLAVHRFAAMSISNNGNNERVWGYLVSGNYFDVLGVNAFHGRTFAPDEDTNQNEHPVAVISYGCWQRRFGGDPAVAGKNILINGHSFTLIGVAPQRFYGTEIMFEPEFWVPSMMQPWIEPGGNGLETRGNGQWFAFGRLKPGISRSTAEAALTTINAQLSQEYPKSNVNQGATMRMSPPGLVFPGLRQPTLTFTAVLMVTVTLVLLIACTNLANLLLARATHRRKEIAVRLALGASRLRLIRQLLTESILLSILGAAAGLAIGLLLMNLIKGLAPPIDFGLFIDLRFDWRVFGFVAFLAIVTGIGFGLLPALQATKPDVVAALKDESTVAGHKRSVLRNSLVVVQIALSLVLLITAGLIVRSLQYVRSIGPGFDPDHALTMSVDVGLQGYDQDHGQEFYRQLTDRVKSLPGVQSTSVISYLPLSLDFSGTGVAMEGEPAKPASETPSAMYASSLPGYFSAMRIPILQGRDFTEQDKKDSTQVAIVNETFTRRFWPGQNAVGKRFLVGGATGKPVEIVGVVKNGKYFSLGEDPAMFIYLPMTQQYSTSVSLIVRSEGDPRGSIVAIREEIRKLDATLPIYDVKTLTEHMGLSLFPLRIGASVIGCFGLLALILAALGIYGVMSYSVSQRTHEIGIRMALGANAGDVLLVIVRQGVIVTIIGIGLGLIGALLLGMVVASILNGVSGTDPMTFAVISLLLGVVTLIACYIPARRATKVDPFLAIRSQ